MVTHERLVQLLDYDPETGIFHWRQDRGGVKAGDPAGCGTGQGYIRVVIDGQHYLAHRLAWFYVTGEWPRGEIDHRDLSKANNAWANLRDVTRGQNMLNRRAQARNRLGMKGVSETRAGKFTAIINKNKVRTYLGTFENPYAAQRAYARAAADLHGAFARAV